MLDREIKNCHSPTMTTYQEDPNTYAQWSRSKSPYTVIEWYVFLRTIGSVQGKSILDLACGDGRLSRQLIDQGAAKVIGTDLTAHMIDQALAQNTPGNTEYRGDALSYAVVDAADADFRLKEAADLVTAMYLFHYATNRDRLFAMCRHIARNVKPGGRFVTYTINPEYNFDAQSPEMEREFGFRYGTVSPPHHTLIIDGFDVDIWQWSTADHVDGLHAAGFKNVRWHPLELPPERKELIARIGWYMENPSCVVLSAEKPTF